MSGRRVISIGLEKKYGHRLSCLLYSRGDGKGIHTEGLCYRRVREAQKVSFPGPVVQLAGSRRSEQGCEVPHDGPLVAEADKQVGNAIVCASLLQRPNCLYPVSEHQEKTTLA